MSTKTAKTHHGHNKPSGSRQARPRPATDAAVDRGVVRKRPAPRRRRRGFEPSWGQLIAVAAVLVVGGFFFLGGRGSTGGAVKATEAPGFTMPSTAGGSGALSDFAGHNVLLYFNEGVGCDACFYQTVELEKAGDELAAKDIALVPIVMNPIDQVRGELVRFGIATPYLIDVDGSVSTAYGVLGKGMHANLPGHGFVFIDTTGRIRWQKEYPSMYASAQEVLGAIDRYVA